MSNFENISNNQESENVEVEKVGGYGTKKSGYEDTPPTGYSEERTGYDESSKTGYSEDESGYQEAA